MRSQTKDAVAELIRLLYVELDRVTRVIEAMESLVVTGESPTRRSTRGRKSMGEAERQEVSRRIKRYWENRRRAPKIPEESGGL